MQVNFARFWNTPFVQLFCLSFLSIKMLVFRNFPILFDPTPAKNVFFLKSGLYIEIYFFASQTCCFFLNATGIFRCSWERASNKILDLSWNRWVFFLKLVKIYGATYPLLFRFRQTVKLSHQENSATKCTFVHKRNIKVARMVTYLTFGIY